MDIHFPEKCHVWRLYSEQGPNDWTKFAEIFRVSYGADLEQSSHGAHSGGGQQGGKFNVLAYMKGNLKEFLKLTLAPACSVSGLLSLQIWTYEY